MNDEGLGELAAPIAELLASLTPQRVSEALAQLVAARPERLHSGVSAHELVTALLGPLAAASGPASWRARETVRAAVREIIATMSGVRYVEGDA